MWLSTTHMAYISRNFFLHAAAAIEYETYGDFIYHLKYVCLRLLRKHCVQ